MSSQSGVNIEHVDKLVAYIYDNVLCQVDFVLGKCDLLVWLRLYISFRCVCLNTLNTVPEPNQFKRYIHIRISLLNQSMKEKCKYNTILSWHK